MYGSYWHTREGLQTRRQNAPYTGANSAMTHHDTYPPPATSPVHRSSKLDSSHSSHKVSVQPAIVEGLAPGPTTRNESLSVLPHLSELQHPSGQSSDNQVASPSGSKGKTRLLWLQTLEEFERINRTTINYYSNRLATPLVSESTIILRTRTMLWKLPTIDRRIIWTLCWTIMFWISC